MALFDGLLLEIKLKNVTSDKKDLRFYVNVFHSHLTPREWYKRKIDIFLPKNNKIINTKYLSNVLYVDKKDENYNDVYYILSLKEKIILFISFRVSTTYKNYDYSDYLPYFQALVKSIKVVDSK